MSGISVKTLFDVPDLLVKDGKPIFFRNVPFPVVIENNLVDAQGAPRSATVSFDGISWEAKGKGEERTGSILSFDPPILLCASGSTHVSLTLAAIKMAPKTSKERFQHRDTRVTIYANFINESVLDPLKSFKFDLYSGSSLRKGFCGCTLTFLKDCGGTHLKFNEAVQIEVKGTIRSSGELPAGNVLLPHEGNPNFFPDFANGPLPEGEELHSSQIPVPDFTPRPPADSPHSVRFNPQSPVSRWENSGFQEFQQLGDPSTDPAPPLQQHASPLGTFWILPSSVPTQRKIQLGASDDKCPSCESLVKFYIYYGMEKFIVWKLFWYKHVVGIIYHWPAANNLLQCKDYATVTCGLLWHLQECSTLKEKYQKMRIPYLITKQVANGNSIFDLINEIVPIDDQQKRHDVVGLLANKVLQLAPVHGILDNATSSLMELVLPFPYGTPFVSYLLPLSLNRQHGAVCAVALTIKESGDVDVILDGHTVANKPNRSQYVFKLLRQHSALFFATWPGAHIGHNFTAATVKAPVKDCTIDSCSVSRPVDPYSYPCYIITGNNLFYGCFDLLVNDMLVPEAHYDVLTSEMILLRQDAQLWGHDVVINKVVVRSKFKLADNQPTFSSTWTGNHYSTPSEANFNTRLCNIVPCDLSVPGSWFAEIEASKGLPLPKPPIASGKLVDKDSGWRLAVEEYQNNTTFKRARAGTPYA